MKTILLFFSILLFQNVAAQNITFANANLKNYLLNSKTDYNELHGNSPFITYPNIDSNADGEISQTEALLVNGINLYYTQVDNYGGLEFFTNLKRFESLYFSTDFDFPSLINLEVLNLTNAISSSSSINNLNLSVHPNLIKVTCYTNGTLDLSGLINLKSLYLGGNFTQIDISDNINLLELNLYAPLNDIDLSSNTKLIYLSLYCSIQNLDLQYNTNLESVELSNNELETLNLGTIKHIRRLNLNNNLLQELNTENLFNLQILQVSNNNLISLSIRNKALNFGDNSDVIFNGNPTLQTICCDANEIVYVQNICNQNNYTASVTECVLTPTSTRPLTMYPNPVKDILHLDCLDKINRIEVFGTNGLLIMVSETVIDVVDMQSLQNGMYFLKVYRENSVDDLKFIKG